MDWEIYHLEQTRHLWEQEERSPSEDLVSPVPGAVPGCC